MRAAFLLALLAAFVAAAPPTVVLGPGTVIGTATSLPSSTATVNKFLSIPYAITPPKRFLPPERLEHYQGGVVNATVLPHSCFQAHNNAETTEDMADESEDCLYINVYAPTGCGCKAVLFWIYGGDLQMGSSADPTFDGTELAAAQDVVVVTFNYRVNAFGFSSAPSLPLTSRNAGFLDQRAALQWVQDNIGAFGGDPNKVTIFGESSGASSVDRLLTTMIDNPPFRGAIAESGQATVSAFPNDTGPKAWAALVAALNCTSATGDQEAEFACVQAADAHTIRGFVAGASFPYFTPVTDNVTQRATPFLDARRAGDVAKVPVIYGTNGQEGLFLAQVYLITNFSAITEDAVYQLLLALTGNNATAELFVQEAVALQSQYPWLDLFEAGAQLYTEIIYQCPAKYVTQASSNASIPTWRYYYNATIDNIQPAGFPNLHASHGSELRIVWGTYNRTTATDQEVAISNAIQTAWANFAKNPSEGPGWKMVDASGDDLACIGCNGDYGIQIINEDVVDERCALFAGLYTATTPYF